MGFGPSEQAPGFRPTTLPPTCRAAATLCDFLPRVWRLDISGKKCSDEKDLCCEVSAMMVTARWSSSGQSDKTPPYTAPRSLCLDLNMLLLDRRSKVVHLGWGLARPEGVEKSAGVLKFQGVATSLPLLVWLPRRGVTGRWVLDHQNRRRVLDQLPYRRRVVPPLPSATRPPSGQWRLLDKRSRWSRAAYFTEDPPGSVVKGRLAQVGPPTGIRKLVIRRAAC